MRLRLCFALLMAMHLCNLCAQGDIISFTADAKSQDIQLYWKDDKGANLKSIANLKNYVERRKRLLVFAANGGMYKADHSPVGLFIQDQKMLMPLDTISGAGNFYLKPNGVFYLTKDGRAFVCKTEDFMGAGTGIGFGTDSNARSSVTYATQSGPMLVIEGKIHPSFKEGSDNLNVRNGVGILADGRVIFAMSRDKISFYDFAKFFRDKGCRNALFLDGFVSRTYVPQEKWVQTDGSFGVMIGVTVPQ